MGCFFRFLFVFIPLFALLGLGLCLDTQQTRSLREKRRTSMLRVYRGFRRFIVGLGKKVFVANMLGMVVDDIFATQISTLSPVIVWVGICFYTLQIYFDFSGYSDMVIGLGKMFGFRLPENFRYPYRSRSITEFWRRWHMTLSGWFRQYVYISMGGNRKGLLFTCFNLAVVFLLTGLWHGTAWTFIAWGAWNGFFIIVEKVIAKRMPACMWALGHFYALSVIVGGWVLFRSSTLAGAADYFQMMFGLFPNTETLFGLGYYVRPVHWVVAALGLFWALGGGRPLFLAKGKTLIAVDLFLWGVLGGVILMLTASGYQPFIYFRF